MQNALDDYGATAQDQLILKPKSAFTHSFRKRLNAYAVCLALVIPYGIFAAVLSSLCFSFHFYHEGLTWLVTIAGLVVVLIFLYLAVSAYSKQRHLQQQDPMWYLFCYVTSQLLWIAAVIAGCVLYYSYFLKYYEIANLGNYSGISPSRSHGQELMDASSVIFETGTHVNVDLSMSFRDSKSYCVAPITIGSDPLAAYDFWAVGENCCSPTPGDFRCGAFNDVNALGGLRVFDDSKQAMYRLAVQQAEARYHIQAIHPIFFTWMHDPAAQTASYWSGGLRGYIFCMVVAFALQFLLVTVATIVFVKTVGHMVFNIYPGP